MTHPNLINSSIDQYDQYVVRSWFACSYQKTPSHDFNFSFLCML
uniref:Uncharacterized protein n=1 Tax=Musa acuminata subsp. malaccensis TaxID=214687 RepID=A0A804I1X9_MUSAM